MTYSSFRHIKPAPIVTIRRFPVTDTILLSSMHVDYWSYIESLCRSWSTEWMHRVCPDSFVWLQIFVIGY